MRVAIVHDWLYVVGGAERVLREMLRCYPHADVFTLFDVLDDRDRAWLGFEKAHTSFLQRVPRIGRVHRLLLPLMPLAIEQLDFSGYDLVISSSYAVAKGVITGPDQVHVAYVHSPMRYAWDLQNEYLRETAGGLGVKNALARMMLYRIRVWEASSAVRPNLMIANSAYIARRIRKVLGRDARIIHPPVDVPPTASPAARRHHFLAAGRLVSYKHFGAIVDAFRLLPELTLIIAGTGPDQQRLQARAGRNVAFAGYVSDAEMRRLMLTARALIFASEEDFGIVPVEAQAEGTPVLALGRGGAIETVVARGPRKTGMFFQQPEASAIAACVNAFIAREPTFSRDACRTMRSGFPRNAFAASFVASSTRSVSGRGMKLRLRARAAGSRHSSPQRRDERWSMDLPRPPLDGVPSSGADAVNGLGAQIWRRRRVFGAAFTSAFAAFLAIVLVWPPVYFADGTVIVGEQEPTSSSASPAWVQKLGDPADLESQLLIVRSNRMLRLALARVGVFETVQDECHRRTGLGAWLKRGFFCDELTAGSQRLLEYVNARYSIRAVGRSRIIAIGYTSQIPEAAFIMANALLLTYLEDQRAENARGREASAAWLLKEAERLRGGPVALDDRSPEASSHLQQQFFQELYQKATDFESERRNLLSSARLVSLAEMPRSPYFPKKGPLLATGLTIALLLGGMTALYRDATDPALRRVRELESLIKAPVLARIPHMESPPHALSPRRIDVPRKPAVHPGLERWRAANGPFLARPWRALRAPLRTPLIAWWKPKPLPIESQSLLANLLVPGQGTVRRVLVTSTLPAEGKSFTTMLLARAAADNGRKVLVVDCNLRRPATAQARRPAVGLADVLRGDVDQSQVTVHTAVQGLDVLHAGTGYPCSGMLLIDGDLGEVMRRTEHYDLVLLDGPTTACLPDVRILARHADGVLMCARWGHAVPAHVKGAIDGLRKESIGVLGLVITMVSQRELRLFERQRQSHPA
jgi:Mrp family chromosome partitioning ATPase/glycosyltransferase involved in cell wall biosynthesis